RCAESHKPPTYQRVVEVIEFAVKKGVGVLRSRQRNGHAPYLCTVRSISWSEEILKAIDRVHVSEDQIDWEWGLRSMQNLIKPSAQYLRLLFYLRIVTVEEARGVNSYHEDVEGTSH